MLKVVVDANVLISVLMRPSGAVASVLYDAKDRVELLAPEFIMEELREHQERLILELGLQPEKFHRALELLFSWMTIVRTEVIPQSAREQADDLAKRVDPKDVAYVALALSQQALLWTLDQKLARGLARKKVNIAIDTPYMRMLVDQANP